MKRGSKQSPDQKPLDLDARAADYASEVVGLLQQQMCAVMQARHPELLPVFLGEQEIPENDPTLLSGLLQAWGIWFQLLNIAEENTGMRRRREAEKNAGPEGVSGTFSNVLRWARDAGLRPQQVQRILDDLRVCPTITAHPTEAKRVTVLQIHRRIYVLLYRMESERWTEREKWEFVDALRNEVDLLWLTGELRMQKPTVEQEVAWGLHFFSQTIYQRVPETLRRLRFALDRTWPDAMA